MSAIRGGVDDRPGGFAAVRVRWLLLWALVGGVLLTALGEGAALLGLPVSDDLVAALMYLPVAAWVWVAVVRRARVDLRAMLRWPRLGGYWFVVAGLFVVELMFTIGSVILTELVAPTYDDVLAGVGQGNLVVVVVGIVVLPPLVEEVVFRGVLIERWAIRWGLRAAILVSALAFGIMHADPLGAGVFGVITGLLYLRTGSLWPGILIHAANNLVALAGMRLADPGAQVPAQTTTEALVSAGTFLGLSLPFVAWFAWLTWPREGTRTPYQRLRAGGSGTVLSVPAVLWSALGDVPVRLDVAGGSLALSPASSTGGAGQAFATVPMERVAAVYPAAGLLGPTVVVLLTDGSWTTLQVPGSAAATLRLARRLSEAGVAAGQRW